MSPEEIIDENRDALETYAASEKELSDVAEALLRHYDSSISESMSTSESSASA